MPQSSVRTATGTDAARGHGAEYSPGYGWQMSCVLDDVEEARFWSKADRTGDGCWPWKGAPQNSKGYGVFWLRGRNARANRVALELKLGRNLEPSEWALHSCGNPAC